mmetsp:Transcript_14406/g.16644  ORF Transcript_14406/g.16644 Transcript_14406/m.16644 type:complete len:215 (+) Transcript_14406:353-997(+)
MNDDVVDEKRRNVATRNVPDFRWIVMSVEKSNVLLHDSYYDHDYYYDFDRYLDSSLTVIRIRWRLLTIDYDYCVDCDCYCERVDDVDHHYRYYYSGCAHFRFGCAHFRHHCDSHYSAVDTRAVIAADVPPVAAFVAPAIAVDVASVVAVAVASVAAVVDVADSLSFAAWIWVDTDDWLWCVTKRRKTVRTKVWVVSNEFPEVDTIPSVSSSVAV